MARKPDIFDEILLYLRENAKSAQLDFSLDDQTRKDLEQDLHPVQKQPDSVPQNVFYQPPVPQQQDDAEQLQTQAILVPQVTILPPPDCTRMEWEELEQTALSCSGCPLCKQRKSVVFGEGPRNARLMFIGEGPGADEDAQGRPFVGKAGELLTKMIAAMGFDRFTEVYIGNIVKCRPPQNRTPLPEESAACCGYIKRQIELIHPQVIVLLGATPLLALYGLKGITRLRGKWRDWNGIKVMPTFHPAFLLRNPDMKLDVWKDLQLVMKEFGKTPVHRQKA